MELSRARLHQSYRLLPSVRVLDDMSCCSNATNVVVIVIKAQKTSSVSVRSFNLHDVRRDFFNKVIPVHRRSSFTLDHHMRTPFLALSPRSPVVTLLPPSQHHAS